MQRKIARIFFAGMLCLTVSGCATTITSELLLKKMQEQPPLVVDVRSQGEYDTDHIPGAVHIPFYEIDSGLKQLGFSKDDTVVLYCEHGPRAGIAGMTLYFYGYGNFYAVEGHMKAWRAGGLPVEKVVR